MQYKPESESESKARQPFSDIEKIHQSMHTLNRKKSFEFEHDFHQEPTFDSEEIPDQDIFCRNEMKKFANNLKCMRENTDLLNVSKFSIEPSSPQSENSGDIGNGTRRKSNATGILTLSLNENSCNAVDLPISVRKCDDVKDIMADLSFNGKISNEITQPSAIDVNGPMPIANAAETSDENVANNTSQSNLEIFRLETSREIMNEQSPDIFADDDDDDDTGIDTSYVCENNTTNEYFGDDSQTTANVAETQFDVADLWNRKEKADIRRIQSVLSGILPPPSITFCQYDVSKMLELYKTNSENLQTTDENSGASGDSAFSKTEFIPDELDGIEWPKVRNAAAHGVHYNRTKYSDSIEAMYMKVAERHIGHETSSSFTFDASANTVKKPVKKM